MYNSSIHNDKIVEAVQAADLVCKVGFGVLDFIGKHPNECRNTVHKNISQLMLQMALVKLESIITLVKHPIELKLDKSSCPFIDPMSLVSTERSLYELLVVHHVILVQNKTTEQKEIAIKVWENAGLSNRLNLLPSEILSDEANKIIANDTNTIESNYKFIFESRLYKSLDEKGKNIIKKSCKKLKPIYFIEDQSKIAVHQVTFDGAYKILYSIDEDESIAMAQYRKMSFLSHPSFLGVLQFGLQSGAPDSYCSEPIMSSAHFCAKMIKEVVALIPESSPTFLNLDIKHCSIISTLGADSITIIDKSKESVLNTGIPEG